MRGGDGVEGLEGRNRFLGRCKLHFIREHENLFSDPSNNISIYLAVNKTLQPTTCA